MPSSKALWYAGAAAAGTAVVGGVVLIVREVRRSKTMAPSGLEGGSLPPTVPPTPTPKPGVVLQSPGDEIRAEICRQWKVGNNRPQWRAGLWAVVQGAVEQQIAIQDTSWTDLDELRLRAFRVAKDALGSMCPEVPLPGTMYSVEQMRIDAGIYWGELWDVFYSTAYGLLSGSTSGPQPS